MEINQLRALNHPAKYTQSPGLSAFRENTSPGGYEALAKVLKTLKPEEVCDTLERIEVHKPFLSALRSFQKDHISLLDFEVVRAHFATESHKLHLFTN